MKRPIRVLFIEFADSFGGAVLSLAELVPAMKDVGVEAHVLAFQAPEAIEGLFPGVPTMVRRRFVSYVTRDRWLRFLRRNPLTKPFTWLLSKAYTLLDHLHEYYLALMIRGLVRRYRIDVLHLNNGLTVEGLRAAVWCGIPCVAHMRGHITGNTRHILDRYPDHVRKSFTWAITISESVRRAGLAHGVAPGRMATVYNPVDRRHFDAAAERRGEIRAAYGLGDERVVLGSFGRIMRFKGQKEFLEAFRSVLPDFPHAVAMIVGDSSDAPDPEYLDEVKAIAAGPELRDRVVFTGYRRDVEAYYHACDVIVHNSLGPEGFGRVVAEGMVCGKAVIAMDEGGPAEIVADGVDGLLVEPRSVSALAAAMRRVLESPELRTRLGAAARRTTLERFAPEVIAAQIAELYTRKPEPAARRSHRDGAE